MHFAIHGAEVQVPALKGMTVADARSQTAGLGLNLEVDNRYYSVRCGRGTHPHAIAGAGHRGAPRVARARGREPGPAKGGSAGHRGRRRARGCAETAPRGAGRGRDRAVALRSGAEDGTVLAQDPPAHAQGIEGPSINLLVAAPAKRRPMAS